MKMFLEIRSNNHRTPTTQPKAELFSKGKC